MCPALLDRKAAREEVGGVEHHGPPRERLPIDDRERPLPDVTVLIPAHNEENVIVQTVTSVLLSDLRNLRIIVVDDGSTDKTGELLDANYAHEPRVRIIHQVNRGKAAALNLAMSEADTEIVVTIDADTEIEFKYLEGSNSDY